MRNTVMVKARLLKLGSDEGWAVIWERCGEGPTYIESEHGETVPLALQAASKRLEQLLGTPTIILLEGS